jgi:hypothetical protein
MLIINIPIEPIEMRYSVDLDRWFKEALTKKKYNFITIEGTPLSKGIDEGAFLDVCGTMNYKAQQIEIISRLVKNGTIPRNERVVFIMHDGWFPVDQLAYMRDMLGCHEWKFVGLFRAGTYDRWDQLAQHGMYQWGEDLENSWFKIYNKIIVASHFHKQMLLERRKVVDHKFEVIPWKEEVPKDLVGLPKVNQVIFPHRINVEKDVEAYQAMRLPEGWDKTASAYWCKTKRDYYEALSASKIAVSMALQETYGHAMIEAVLLGCIPLVPYRLSYKELFPRKFRYQGESEFKYKLSQFTNSNWENLWTDGLQNKQSLLDLRHTFEENSRQFFPRLFKVVEDL